MISDIISKIISKLPKFDIITLILFLIIGLGMAFFGEKILKTIAFVIGAAIGALLAYSTVTCFELYFGLNPIVCIILATLIGAILGGFLGIGMMYGMIAFYFGMIGFIIGIVAFGALNITGFIIAIIIGVIFFVVMSIFIEQFLAISTAIFGGILTGFIALFIVPPIPVGLILFIIISVVVSALGAKFQLETQKKKKT